MKTYEWTRGGMITSDGEDGDSSLAYVLFTDCAAKVERLNNHITELISDNTKFIVERDAAIARAEQVEEALRGIVARQTGAANSTVRKMASIARAALAAAPDKQYAALSPEPWGGPEE